jgi:hypothetical protein
VLVLAVDQDSLDIEFNTFVVDAISVLELGSHDLNSFSAGSCGSFAIPRAFHKRTNFDQRPISTDLKPEGPI